MGNTVLSFADGFSARPRSLQVPRYEAMSPTESLLVSECTGECGIQMKSFHKVASRRDGDNIAAV